MVSPLHLKARGGRRRRVGVTRLEQPPQPAECHPEVLGCRSRVEVGPEQAADPIATERPAQYEQREQRTNPTAPQFGTRQLPVTEEEPHRPEHLDAQWHLARVWQLGKKRCGHPPAVVVAMDRLPCELGSRRLGQPRHQRVQRAGRRRAHPAAWARRPSSTDQASGTDVTITSVDSSCE